MSYLFQRGLPSATQEQVMAWQARQQRRRSTVNALIVAAVLHAVLLAIFGIIVFQSQFRREAEIVVQAAPAETSERVTRREFASVRQSNRPAAPSSALTQIVTAQTLSEIPLPETDLQVDDMDLGTGWGDGFGSGALGAGTGQGTGFFGTPGGGSRVILLIDVSTSMPQECGERGLAAIKDEVRRVIESFPESTQFNLICFGNDADGFAPRPLPATGENKRRAHAFMQDYFSGRFTRTRTEQFGRRGDDGAVPYTPIQPSDIPFLRGTSGGSRYDLALCAAFLQRPDTIFLITDGEPSTQRGGKSLSKQQIIDLVVEGARESGRERLPRVHCISINGIGAGYLRDIAEAFGGQYRDISPREL